MCVTLSMFAEVARGVIRGGGGAGGMVGVVHCVPVCVACVRLI